MPVRSVTLGTANIGYLSSYLSTFPPPPPPAAPDKSKMISGKRIYASIPVFLHRTILNPSTPSVVSAMETTLFRLHHSILLSGLSAAPPRPAIKKKKGKKKEAKKKDPSLPYFPSVIVELGKLTEHAR